MIELVIVRKKAATTAEKGELSKSARTVAARLISGMYIYIYIYIYIYRIYNIATVHGFIKQQP